MKQILFLAALVFQFSASAQKTIITGKLTNPKDDKIVISYHKGAALFKFNEVKKETFLDSAGNFSMELDLDVPSIVKIAFNESYFEAIGQVGYKSVDLFIEPGNNLAVDLSPRNNGKPETFEGTGAANNNFMVQLDHNFLRKFYGLKKQKLANTSVNEYLLFLYSFASAERVFYHAHTAGLSPNFQQYITDKINYFAAREKLDYPFEKKRETKQDVKLPADYYKFLEKMQVQNDDALYMWEYISFVEALVGYQVYRLMKEVQFTDSAQLSINYYNNAYGFAKMYLTGKTREVILASSAYDIIRKQPLPEAEKIVEDVKNNVTDTALVNFVVKYFAERKKLAESEIAPQFTLKDAKGKEVSLQDFRGKVVYLCFWASWCSPCKYEIPYAMKLQEKFKGKDVVFLYISVDESDEMWKKAISSSFKGKGIHLISKKTAENIQEKYNVSGPPAFYLIDRNGKIIDDNANRPSEEITAEVLRAALQKQ